MKNLRLTPEDHRTVQEVNSAVAESFQEERERLRLRRERRHAIPREEIRRAIESLLLWATRTEQPDEAVIMHHGAAVSAAHWSVCLAPVRPYGGQGGDCVLVFDTHRRTPLSRRQWIDVQRLIGEWNVPIAHSWNGVGSDTGSISIILALHPSLRAAVKRYLAGCLLHKSALCECEDWQRRFELAIYPPILTSADPAPPPAATGYRRSR